MYHYKETLFHWCHEWYAQPANC